MVDWTSLRSLDLKGTRHGMLQQLRGKLPALRSLDFDLHNDGLSFIPYDEFLSSVPGLEELAVSDHCENMEVTMVAPFVFAAHSRRNIDFPGIPRRDKKHRPPSILVSS